MYLVIDVGGTYTKYGYYNEDGSENVIAFIDNCKKDN